MYGGFDVYISPQGGFDSMGLGAPGLSMGQDDGLDESSAGGLASNVFSATNGDDIARMIPPFPNSGYGSGSNSSLSSSGSMLGMFEPLFSAIGSLFSQMSQMFSGSNSGQNGPLNFGNCTQTGNPGNGSAQSIAQPWQSASQPWQPTQEQAFQNVRASSTGDPHLAFNGTNANGSTADSHWDNMSSHTDLIDSDSFRGGYRVSTQATQPNANGITYNQNATVSTDGGNVAVELDANGNATLSRFGNITTIQDGQNLNLGNGESVARNNDGSLVISDKNQQGATIATTLRDNGSGVDISVQGNNLNLGGYMVNRAATSLANSQRSTDPAEMPR
jgi:hypothetical protein